MIALSVGWVKISKFFRARERFKIGYKNCHPPVCEIFDFLQSSHSTKTAKYSIGVPNRRKKYFVWWKFCCQEKKWWNISTGIAGLIMIRGKKNSESPIPFYYRVRPSRCLWFSRSFAYNGSFFFFCFSCTNSIKT